MFLVSKVKSLCEWVGKDKLRLALTLVCGLALTLGLITFFPVLTASLLTWMGWGTGIAIAALAIVFPIMLINALVFICFRACLRWAADSTQASVSENLSLAGKAAIYTGLAAAFVGGGFIPVGVIGAIALVSIGIGAALAKGVFFLAEKSLPLIPSVIEKGMAVYTYFRERWAQARMGAVNPPAQPPLPQPIPAAASHAQALQQLGAVPAAAALSSAAAPPTNRSHSTSMLLPPSRTPSPDEDAAGIGGLPGIPLRPLSSASKPATTLPVAHQPRSSSPAPLMQFPPSSTPVAAPVPLRPVAPASSAAPASLASSSGVPISVVPAVDHARASLLPPLSPSTSAVAKAGLHPPPPANAKMASLAPLARFSVINKSAAIPTPTAPVPPPVTRAP